MTCFVAFVQGAWGLRLVGVFSSIDLARSACENLEDSNKVSLAEHSPVNWNDDNVGNTLIGCKFKIYDSELDVVNSYS